MYIIYTFTFIFGIIFWYDRFPCSTPVHSRGKSDQDAAGEGATASPLTPGRVDQQMLGI